MEPSSSPASMRLVVRAWLVVATLDIIAAIIQTLAGGGSLERLGQYIASGVFGPVVFKGGLLYVVTGYLFHYGIAFGWTALFFFLYSRLKVMSRHWLVTGIGYGIFVWFMMNRVILPLSNVPQGPFDLSRAALACAILIAAIGLPLAWMLTRRER